MTCAGLCAETVRSAEKKYKRNKSEAGDEGNSKK